MIPLEEAELQALLKSDQGYDLPGFGIRVAEVGSLSARAKMAIKIFVKRVFTILAQLLPPCLVL